MLWPTNSLIRAVFLLALLLASACASQCPPEYRCPDGHCPPEGEFCTDAAGRK